MKRDKILLTAIIGVVVAILGFVFLSDGTEASGGNEGDSKTAANRSDPTSGSALTTLDNRMGSDRNRLIQTDSDAQTRDLVEWQVPAGIEDFRAASVELTGDGGNDFDLARWNASITGPLAGQRVQVPRAWKEAMDLRLAAVNSGTPGTAGGAKGQPEPPAKKAADVAKPAPKKAAKKSVAPVKTTGGKRGAATTAPWNEYLLKKGLATRGSGAPKTARARTGVGTDAGAGAALATDPKAGSRYVIREGDSLWKIAKVAYGKGHLWSRILEANPKTLPSEDTPLRPGKVIYIPKPK